MEMFESFEDKGKVFTQVISKSPIRIIMQTTSHRIVGNMYVRVGDRLKDELDSAIHFLPVTDAQVFDILGERLIFNTNFLAVNFEHVVWVLPEEELLKKQAEN